MDVAKLKKGELQTQSFERLQELELDIRQELAKVRMDIFSEKGANTGKKRQLRKNLARTLTFSKQKTMQKG